MYKKLVIPFLLKHKKFFLAISIALALSMGLLFGFISGCDTTDSSLDGFAKDYRYGDAIITTDLMTKESIAKINDIKGLKTYNTRLCFYTKGEINNSYVNVKVFSYNNNFALQYIYEINESNEYPNVSINNSFLDKNKNIKLSDTIKINLADKTQTLSIGKAISSPDCVSMYLNEYIYGHNPDLAYIYLPEEYLIDTEYANKYNQIFIYFEDWANKDEVLSKIEEVIGKDNIIDSVLYSESLIRKNIDVNLKPVENLAKFLPATFFIIVIAVSFLFLSQIIKQSHKDIGILRTLGFKIIDITKAFSLMVLVSSIVSIVLGTILGFILTIIISNLYAHTYNIPIVDYIINFKVYVISIIATILSGQLAVIFSINQIKNISPKQAIDAQTINLSDSELKIVSYLSVFNSRLKYSLSSIIRNKTRFISSSFCLTASVILIFTSWAFYDSKNEIRDSLFKQRIKYDYQYFYNNEITDEDIKLLDNLDTITDYEKLGYLKTTITFNDKQTGVTIKGIEDNSKLIGLYEYESIDDIDKGIIIEKHIADKIGASLQDVVTINNKPYKIIGMVNEYVDRYCYVDFSILKDISNVSQYSVVLNASNPDDVVRIACDNDSISILSSTESIKKGIDSEFRLYNIGVYIIIGFALIIGFIIIYNSTLATLMQQKKELSVLRTIGYQVKDISKMWIGHTIIQTLIALPLGLLFGKYFAKFAMHKISTSSREYPFTTRPSQYILTIIIVVIFVIFTHIISMRTISKYNLVENTKEKD